MIYTSYYANKTLQQNKNFIFVQISLSKPISFTVDYNIPQFAPSWSLLNDYKNKICDEQQYKSRYIEELNKYPKERFIKFINWCKTKDKDIVLLCYEGKDKFCHRHILAEYLMKIDSSLNIKEY